MSNYRRFRVPGARVFFTVNLAERGSDLLVREVAVLRAAVRVTRAERPFGIEAWVVLPDHIHAIWGMPEGDADYSTRWAAIKARFTRGVRAKYGDDHGADRRPGFTPAIPAHGSPLPTRLPVVRSGRYAGVNPGLRSDKGECGIWQRRFWEHTIRDEADFNAHLRYCWMNPVKHRLVERPEEWALSSVHRDARFATGEDLGV